MQTQESVKIKGHINIKLFDRKGNIKEFRDIDNVIVTVGKNFLASWLKDATQSTSFMQYVALGTGTNAADASDTDLQTPLGSRVAGTLTSNTNIWQNQATFAPGAATGALTESGLFSESTGGTLFARQVFPVVNKQAGDTIVFTWQVTLS